MRSPPILTATVLLSATQFGCAVEPARATVAPAGGARPSIVVEALSRGKGVPDRTYAALEEARSLLQRLQKQGKVVGFDETRVGLEGETRLCVEFEDRTAAGEAMRQLRSIADGVELLNVLERPCGSR